MNVRNLSLTIAALVLMVLTSWSQNDRLTPEKLWELGRVGLEDLSADGAFTLYGVKHYDVSKNSGTRNLFLIRSDGADKGKGRQLTNFTEGSPYNAQFHPQQKKIGFLYQGLLHEVDYEGKKVVKVSDQEMEGFKYAPDGSKILFTRQVKYDKTTAELYPDLPLAQGKIIDNLMYRHWDTWEDGLYSNVFVMDYRNGKLVGTPKNIINEPYDVPLRPFGGMEQINWTPDSKSIAYTCKKTRGIDYAVSTDSDIYLYNTASAKTVNLTDGMDGYDMEATFSPNGRYMLWNSMEKPGFESDRNRVFVLDFETDRKWELTAGYDQSMNHPQFSKDGSRVYCIGGYKATYQLYELSFPNGKLKVKTNGNHNINSVILGPEFAVATKVSMSAPQEIYRVTYDAGMTKQLTRVTEPVMDNLKMGRVAKRKIETTDGQMMEAWVIYPPDFDETKKYPTLLYCQGGPQSAVSQFWSYRWNFQLMAANDYIIIAPNRRGLPTFGREWNDAISGDWGGQPMEDLLSAIDDLKSERYVDTTRLGAVGASYGGYSVYWLAGNHDQRFKALISHCGLFNLESWYGTTEELFFANQDIGGPYWVENPAESYLKDSPHLYVKNWDTPILVIHGEKDFRVPISEGMQAFQVAQIKNIPSRFLYFPNEGHWVQSPQNGLLWHRVFFDWLDTHVKGE